MKALITGITGQDGSILAKQLLDKNYQVVGQSRKINLSSFENSNLLGTTDKIEFIYGDLVDYNWLVSVFQKHNFDEIYHFAAQSSVSFSHVNPHITLFNNSISTLNLLELIRISSPNTRFLNACSSEIYGNNVVNPLNENSRVNPFTPYGLSKSTSYYYVKFYREKYNIFACNAILFNHESRFRKGDFFIKKVINSARAIKKNEIDYAYFGNLNLKRDFGYAPDYMYATYLMLKSKSAKDYVIASGFSVKLLDIVKYVFSKFNISNEKIKSNSDLYRYEECIEIKGDSSAIREDLGWVYNKTIYDIIDLLIDNE